MATRGKHASAGEKQVFNVVHAAVPVYDAELWIVRHPRQSDLVVPIESLGMHASITILFGLQIFQPPIAFGSKPVVKKLVGSKDRADVAFFDAVVDPKGERSSIPLAQLHPARRVGRLFSVISQEKPSRRARQHAALTVLPKVLQHADHSCR